MAVSFVNSTSNSTSDGTDVTIDLTAITGLAEDDVVYVSGCPSVFATPSTPSGWTEVASADVGANTDKFKVYRKVMGATPDTSVTCTGSGSDAFGAAWIAMAYRGVDTTTPEDVTPTVANGASSQIDCPSISPSSNDCMVMAAGCGFGAATGAPTGYSGFISEDPSASVNMTASGAYKLLSGSSAEDPGVFGGSTTTWAGATVAMRPASGGGNPWYYYAQQ